VERLFGAAPGDQRFAELKIFVLGQRATTPTMIGVLERYRPPRSKSMKGGCSPQNI